MNLLTTLILALICTFAYSQTGFQEYYGEMDKGDYGESIIELSDGDFMQCGVQVYYDSISETYVGEGVVRKIASNGEEIWSVNYSDPNSPEQNLNFYSIIETSDGNFVLAGSSDYGYENEYNQAFLMKIDAAGNTIWQQSYGGLHSQTFRKVVETLDGGLVMAGANHTTGSANSRSLYVIATDADGNLQWQYTHPNDPDDGVRHHAYSIVEDSFGNYILSGSINQILDISTDFFAVKISSSGNLEWETIIDHPIGGQGRDIFVKDNGDILICGWYAPNLCAKPLIIELNENGDFIDEHEFNFNITCEWAHSFYKDSSDNVVMLSFNAENKYRVTKIDDSFDELWSYFVDYDQGTSANGNDIYGTSAGGYVCTGASIIQGDIEAVAFKLDENGLITNLSDFSSTQPVALYPNPATNAVKLDLNGNVLQSAISLYDLKGTLVRDYNPSTRVLDLSGTPAGMYVLKFQVDGGMMHEKLIVE